MPPKNHEGLKINTSHREDLRPTSRSASDLDDPKVLRKWSDEDEKRLVRKLDRRILPITCLLYLFAYLDRSNLGNARLQGLEEVLGGDPTGTLFDWLNSAFFFPYIMFQTPATILSKLFPPSIWIASCAIGWGLSSTLTASAFNFAGLLVCRIFIGTFEAGFGPAIPLYFSLFYTKEEVGLRLAYWFGFAAVAGAFGGIIAFGIQHIPSYIPHWRFLFIIEGIPAILIGIVAFFFLPNRPESTAYLTSDEREIAIDRMNRATSADTGAVLNRAHIMMAFKDWRVYTAGLIFFGLNTALASISAFLPTILKTFNYTDARAQLFTVPPYAVAAFVLILFSYVSDRWQTRGVPMAIASFIGAVGYILLLSIRHNVHVRYFATFCITSGTYATIGLIIAWFAHNLGSETKKATGIPLFIAIGQCGSILGSHLYPLSEGPHYIQGFSVTGALLFLGSICSLALSVSYRHENARRDKLYGKPVENARVDTRELADEAPSFRYIP